MPNQLGVLVDFDPPSFKGGTRLLLLLLSLFVLRYQRTQYPLLLAALLSEPTKYDLLSVFSLDKAWKLFFAFFLYRYVRLVVNIVGFFLYKPHLPGVSPKYTGKDVTVVVPTVDPGSHNFRECIRSILNTSPAKVFIVTAGKDKDGNLNYQTLCEDWGTYPNMQLMECAVMNKRRQLCTAIPLIETPFTIFTDDHIFYPAPFLPHVLAPFTDPNIGIVGTSERVRRTILDFSLAGFCNVLAALYSEQEKLHDTATFGLERGVYVVSGRASAHRTCIIQDPAFLKTFLNDFCFFGLVGPLNADDDNFITRWNIAHGWDVGFQAHPEATIEITAGDHGGFEKYLSQNLRWMRTKWRSNFTSLFGDFTGWGKPWCLYAVFISGCTSLALFYDAALVYTLYNALHHTATPNPGYCLTSLILWIMTTKVIKASPYWYRNPADLVYLPGAILFGYYHSLIKLYALMTFWKIAWGSRKLEGEGGLKSKRKGERG